MGSDCLISASNDLRGNLSRRIIDNIDMLSAYRTAPHIDLQETMQRVCAMLLDCATRRIRTTRAPGSVLLPGERASTEDQPAKDLYAQRPLRNATPGLLDAFLLVGYAWSATQPLILADSGDNPTGGGVGDSAEVLEGLLSRNFANALVAGIADPPATERCYQHAPGSRLTLRIGASPENQLRPRTFPFDRSFSWRPSTIVSARSPRETR